MKTSTALKLAKKIEKDCRKAQMYCQLSESAIKDFQLVVNHCVATKKIAQILERVGTRRINTTFTVETALACDSKEVQECLIGLDKTRRYALKASEQCEKALQTLETTKRVIDLSAFCNKVRQEIVGALTPNYSVTDYWYRVSSVRSQLGRTAPADEDLAMMPPEAIGTIIDRTGG